MRKYRYLIGIIYIICTLLLFPHQTVKADSNRLYEINMQIVIAEDGSASISEKWAIAASEGTEIYKEMRNMGESTIRDFRVTEEEREFETLENWNVEASREEKIGKAGIVRNGNDYELCFGISEYDYREYTMHYTIDRFVAKYQDVYGMNWQLVNQDMDMKSGIVRINITGHGISEDVRMYAFGFEGNINFQNQDGTPSIVATNRDDNDTYRTVEYVNILLELPGVTYTNAIEEHSERTFEDLLEEAKVGSDYEDGNRSDMIKSLWILGIVFVFMGILALIIVFGIRLLAGGNLYDVKYVDGTRENARKVKVDYFRDIPCKQNPYFLYHLLEKASLMQENELRSGLVAAILLEWVRREQVEFVKEEKKTLFSSKDVFKIHFKDTLESDSALEQTLYGYFKEAAGKNEILENKEFNNWCTKNYKRLDAWFEKVESQMDAEWETDGYMQINKATEKFLFLFKVKTEEKLYTPKFREELYHTLGFKKFLLEFGRLGEKEVREVVLWEKYLIFASVLGIADKVEKEIGRLYPEFLNESQLDTTYTTRATRMFAYGGIGRAVDTKYAAQARAYGIGGRSSLGGGGGSFSGGGGGGVR